MYPLFLEFMIAPGSRACIQPLYCAVRWKRKQILVPLFKFSPPSPLPLFLFIGGRMSPSGGYLCCDLASVGVNRN